MLILETDHLTAIDRGRELGARLRRRLKDQNDEFCTTIVSISEQLRGLQALIASAKREADLIERYGRLSTKVESLQDILVLPRTLQASTTFLRLKRNGIRVGTMDLRFASIALSNNATLLTANLRDFENVPGLLAESWLAA